MIYLHLLKDFGVIKAGSVERFAPSIAERLIADGTAELEKDMIRPPIDKQVKAAPVRK